jgi:hypothetical protein
MRLLLNILPQTMVLVGLAGILWMAGKNEFLLKRVLQTSQFKMRLETVRKLAAERGTVAAEKVLRSAKIYAMRLERFFALRLESLVERKNKKLTETGASFWKTVRDRSVSLRKPKTLSSSRRDSDFNIKEEDAAQSLDQEGKDETKNPT